MEDINLNVLGERLDCKPDIYEICVAINKLKDRVNTLEETLFATERKEKVLSWNMSHTGTIEVFRNKLPHCGSIADIWRVKDHPEGELVARAEQVKLADAVVTIPYMLNFIQGVIYSYYGEDGGSTMLLQYVEDESDKIRGRLQHVL